LKRFVLGKNFQRYLKKIKSGYFHHLVCNTHHLVTTLRKARFSFDSRNRLIQAGETSYRYDAENQRIGMNQTSYVINSQPALSQVLVKEENGVKTFYVYGLGLLGEEKEGEYRGYHFDFRGSTVAITDQTGKVVERFQYGPYGELLKGEASVTPFLFNGKYGVMTEGNGLYYMRARFYSPEMKRFVNMDVLLGNVSEGQTLNRFAFVTGRPVSLVDPFGLSGKGIEEPSFWENFIPICGRFLFPKWSMGLGNNQYRFSYH